ncbi:MAG TPA: ATP-binding cassette domain-containing protein [Burkholderiaceae bacterium]|jgi:sulfonate transport system ATP-binding protein|nr:ATP-binding cassette domain-containing protein [Burkholderiaceae bacterium]
MQRDWTAPPAAGLALRLEGLRKQFGARTVLDGIGIGVAPGEFVAIVGRSGCGKSTLLRLLAGLESPTSGQLLLGGAPAAARRDDVRMMFQEPRLLPWRTVIQNVQLGLDAADAPARARDALAHVGLADRANDWPSVLSGGQRQRVALARALVHRPRLLLLDEPLGALDALTRIEMQRLIESVWRELRFTAVLVTHDVAEAVALADRVLLVEDGRATLDEPIPLARPRAHGAAAFAELEGRILARVLQETWPQLEAPHPRLVA